MRQRLLLAEDMAVRASTGDFYICEVSTPAADS
jgi:hypothetical protein